MSVDDQFLLSEVEGLIRGLPPFTDFENSVPNVIEWGGRASTILEKVDRIEFSSISCTIEQALTGQIYARIDAYPKIQFALQRAKSMLILRIPGVRSTAVDQGARFRYFDEITKIVQTAQSELYFVDPFLNNDFLTRYVEPLTKNLKIRLLGKKVAELSTLVQGCKLLNAQGSLKIEIRSTASIHDRYVFVDGKNCFMSGASFKDGAINASTVIVEIVDAFDAMKASYESIWSSAKLEL